MLLPKRLDDIVRGAANDGLFWRNETCKRAADIAAVYFDTDSSTVRDADVLAGESGTDLEQAVAAIRIGRVLNGEAKR